jgi:hypothetical protein
LFLIAGFSTFAFTLLFHATGVRYGDTPGDAAVAVAEPTGRSGVLDGAQAHDG